MTAGFYAKVVQVETTGELKSEFGVVVQTSSSCSDQWSSMSRQYPPEVWCAAAEHRLQWLRKTLEDVNLE